MNRSRITAILILVVVLLAAGVISILVTSLDKGEGKKPAPARSTPAEITQPAVVVTGDQAQATVDTDPAPAPAQTQAPAAETTPNPMINTGVKATPAPAPAQTPAPVTTAPPAVVINTTPAPSPTPGTVPAVTPSPGPVATPAPTTRPAEASFVPSDLGSGSFRSETGAKIDIKADWSARAVNATQAEVTVTVSVISFQLHMVAVPDSVKLSLNGEYVSANAPAVDYNGSAQKTTTLCTRTFTVELSPGMSRSLPLAVEWHFGGTYGGVDLPAIECGGEIKLDRPA